VVSADQDGAFKVSESNLRASQAGRAELAADNANLASWQRSRWINSLDLRSSVYVFLA
jgi:hypothetical protein